MASLAASAPESTTNTNKLSHNVIQNTSKQDFTTSGTTDGFDFLVVADSHGYTNNKFYYTNMFKSIKWNVLLSDESWKERISKLCNLQEKSRLIGTTLSCVKIYETHFEITYIGDSSIKIYKKGEGKTLEDGTAGSLLVWRSKDHDYDNEEDIAELRKDTNIRNISSAWDIQASTPDTMLSKKAKFFTFKDGERTNMTRCLGHRGSFSKLGMVTEIIPRDDEAFYKIVVATDGFWQVMSDADTEFIVNNSSVVLSQTARNRWEQEWTHDNSQGTITPNIKIPSHNWDDIAVASWSN
mgnify:CR=1 FL=1|tara:strand:- start:159 stop:1046 length:888 start_codon:yes stop_codon:yes gene_type:complete